MRPLTESEDALRVYFYRIANDPRVRAAGWSLSALKTALLSRAAEDAIGMLAVVLGQGVEKVETPARKVAGGAARTVLGGTVSPEAADQIAAGVETIVRDGFRGLGDVLDRWSRRGRGTGK